MPVTTSPDLLKAIQSRTARVAVGASAARGRHNKGVVGAARSHLCAFDLQVWGATARRDFRTTLDAETRRLMQKLPPSARRWGLARKLLNIFVRDCYYSRALHDAYSLHRTGDLLEVPLDSITARQLKRVAGRGRLPRWTGVRHLTPENSELFQKTASQEAQRQGLARVDLDAVWWSQNRDL